VLVYLIIPTYDLEIIKLIALIVGTKIIIIMKPVLSVAGTVKLNLNKKANSIEKNTIDRSIKNIIQRGVCSFKIFISHKGIKINF